MKTKLSGILALSALLCACTPARHSGEYTVEGEVSDSSANGKTIYILRYDDNRRVDSTVVKDNKFTFTGTADTASFCRIDVTRSEFADFILEGGNIRVNLKEYNRPSGTAQNDEMARLAVEEDSIVAEMERKREEIAARYTDEEEVNARWKEFVEQCREGWSDRCTELYKKHNDNAVGYYLLYSIYMEEAAPEVKEAVTAGFGPWLKSRKRVRDLIGNMEALKKTKEGQPFTDIKGKDEKGNPAALSDFAGKGNYVLADMWASWCGPCKGEIPNLAKLHNKYKNKGLTVLGIFVWDKEENLGKAMEAEKVTWPQLIDSEGEATRLYGVDGIPHIILFAPDGTILKRGLRGESMIRAVDEVMNNK